jgi:hypothetical protein
MAYDITKARNVAPIMNRTCGTAVAEALEEWLECEADPDLTEEALNQLEKDTRTVKSFLRHLRRNLELAGVK